MNIQDYFPNTRHRWLTKPLQARAYQPWLVDNGSLTRRLQQRYPDFTVRPLSQVVAKPLVDEAGVLQVRPHQQALVREVLLMGGGQHVVFAHSVLPQASLRGTWHGLGQLGSKPLGATLFANPKVKRTPLRYKKLTAHHALYTLAVQHLASKPASLWARRSMFSLNCTGRRRQTIMVTEVFLPCLLNLNLTAA